MDHLRPTPTKDEEEVQTDNQTLITQSLMEEGNSFGNNPVFITYRTPLHISEQRLKPRTKAQDHIDMHQIAAQFVQDQGANKPTRLKVVKPLSFQQLKKLNYLRLNKLDTQPDPSEFLTTKKLQYSQFKERDPI